MDPSSCLALKNFFAHGMPKELTARTAPDGPMAISLPKVGYPSLTKKNCGRSTLSELDVLSSRRKRYCARILPSSPRSCKQVIECFSAACCILLWISSSCLQSVADASRGRKCSPARNHVTQAWRSRCSSLNASRWFPWRMALRRNHYYNQGSHEVKYWPIAFPRITRSSNSRKSIRRYLCPLFVGI